MQHRRTGSIWFRHWGPAKLPVTDTDTDIDTDPDMGDSDEGEHGVQLRGNTSVKLKQEAEVGVFIMTVSDIVSTSQFL